MNDRREQERAADRALVATKRNTARFFTENRHVAWVALVATLAWGVYGYIKMPKAKDPTLELRIAAAGCAWPGTDAKKVESLVTRKIEEKLAESPSIERIESISRTGGAVVYIVLKDEITDRVKEWDAIQGRLDMIHDLPAGAGPIQFERDFGDTATLMLTVASPKASEVELQLRAAVLSKAITAARVGAAGTRATLVISFPSDINTTIMRRLGSLVREYFDAHSSSHDTRLVENPGFLAIDVGTNADDATLLGQLQGFAQREMQLSELHPDVWPIAIIRDPKTAVARLTAAAGDRYSYRKLDELTDQIQRSLSQLPIVGRVTRTGVLPERIFLDYSQQRLAAYNVQASLIGKIVGAQNTRTPGGVFEQDGKNVSVDPSGEFTAEQQIGDVVVSTTANGVPLYLRDLVDINRNYESPPRFLNYLTRRTPTGELLRSRAITLAVTMRRGAQIGDFETQVGDELGRLHRLLPDDLILDRTSDQPLQVSESVSLFMRSLLEAIVLVVLVALVGFWEWRTALLLALSIPITLALTFGLMRLFGVDIQQISIASLIISLGLLIDDPVVASDAIKSSLASGWDVRIAAWLGPTKLATAILFATLTNIAAYLPFLTLTGDVGIFIHSLPVVLTLSLVASRVVSMTFIPLLGAVILRPSGTHVRTIGDLRRHEFGRFYYRVVGWAVDHRFVVIGIAFAFLAGGGLLATRVKTAFFPKDLSYLCYVDIWLPEDATLTATRAKAVEVEDVISQTINTWSPGDHVLRSITEFDGGGGPRFWFSVSPELAQLNYAQLVIQVEDKEDTRHLVPILQAAVTKKVADARVDVRELETGEPVGIPISYRISGENIDQLRTYAEQLKAILRATPGAERVRDDWGADTFAVRLEVNSDRATLAQVTNEDIATSSAVALNGAAIGQFRDGNHEIPIVVRLRADERAQISDIQNLYIHAASGAQKVPLGQVSRIAYSLQPEKIRRRNQLRTITVAAFPQAGHLATEVVKTAQAQIDHLAATMSAGYRLEVGGEVEEQVKSFRNMAVVFVMMMAAIYLALVMQFRNAFKPIIVLAALPFGSVVAILALVAMNAPMSFMAVLGVISLMGVIVSHIIVLFDFIEDAHERGEQMRTALLDAGLMRLRPVLITVAATVLGLVPLALHGGPLWEPLCYAQIGGLTFATILTLVLVPVLYTIAVKDLKLIKWEAVHYEADQEITRVRPLQRPTLWNFDRDRNRR